MKLGDMLNVRHTYEYQIPDYALPALVNGDTSGLSEEDESALNTFLAKEHYIDVWDIPAESEPYFCSTPEFGLACNVIDVNGIVFKAS